jgi:hypothetical protein
MHFNFIHAMYSNNLVLKYFLQDEIMSLQNKIIFIVTVLLIKYLMITLL